MTAVAGRLGSRCDRIAFSLIGALVALAPASAQSDPSAAAPTSSESATSLSLKPEYAYTPYTEWTGGESPTSTPVELDAIYEPRRGVLDIPALDSPFEQFLEWSVALEEATGLRLGFAYTTIFQQASGGPNRRRGASGDFDIMGAWTLLGRGTPETGTLVFSFEDRHKFGPIPASELRNELGALHPPTNGFNDRGWVVRDVYWLQRLFDDRVRVAFGRGDVSDFVGSHGMQSLNISFSNRSLSANTVVPFPGHGMALGVSLRPTEELYATVGAMNGYGSTTINDMKYLDEGDFFTFGEFGFTPHVEGLGRGRFRTLLWHMDARDARGLDLPSDRGFSIILDQDIGESLRVFARYGYADEAVTNIRSSIEAGLGVRGLLGSPDNMTGLAYAYTESKNDGDEKVLESFHRWQLTRFTQFTFGVQGIFDPINSEQDAIAVFSFRFRIAF